MRQPHKDSEIEGELRRLYAHYRFLRNTDQLGAAISAREDLGKYFIEQADDILRMVHGYNRPLSEPEEDDGIPF